MSASILPHLPKSWLLVCLLLRFKEEVAVLERMTGLGDIIRRAGLPTFICLQVSCLLVNQFVLSLSAIRKLW